MEKIDQGEQENPASNGREMIDDFRLRGSRTWRRMGGPLTKQGGARGGAHRWRTILAITILHYQRAKPSPLWSRLWPGIHIGHGLARIAQIRWGKAPCAAGIACPRLTRASWRRTGGGDGGGSDPPLFGAGAPPGRGKWSTLRSTTYPAPRGGRSLHSDPWREGLRAPFRARGG